jgi:hypothetical protein
MGVSRDILIGGLVQIALKLPGIDLQRKRRQSHRRAWRDGLADQTIVENLQRSFID